MSELSGKRSAPGQWEHIVLTVTDDKATLYINGTAVASGGQSLWHNKGERAHLEFAPRGGGYFPGILLDDVRVYDAALSERRVAELLRDGLRSEVETE